MFRTCSIIIPARPVRRAFGLTMAGISSRTAGKLENKIGLNGNEIQTKELSDGSGLDVYDFNARTYDPQIGRFLQLDPLADEGNDYTWSNPEDILKNPSQNDKSPFAAFWNNPIIYNDPDGECPRCLKALAKTAVKSVMKGKLDLGDVYDAVDAVRTIASPEAGLLDKSVALFDLFSPVSSKELKAGAKILGLADGANDASKAAKKINKNSNNAEGNFVLYEIKDKDGKVVKVGKADADRTNAAGQPVRMMDSERKARKEYLGATATQVPNSNQKTTGTAKEAEAAKAREHRANGNSLPLNKERDKRYRNN